MMSNYDSLANFLESNGCSQLANGLRQDDGLGKQRESSGSLNGFHLENPYAQAIEQLMAYGLSGSGFEEARRTVDIVFNQFGLSVAVGERDILAYLLSEGSL